MLTEVDLIEWIKATSQPDDGVSKIRARFAKHILSGQPKSKAKELEGVFGITLLSYQLLRAQQSRKE